MLRHVVLIRWKPDADERARQAVRDALDGLRGEVPEIRALSWGANVGRSPHAYDAAIVMDFDDREAFDRYVASAAHRAYAAGPAREAVAELAVVQHAC